jgi:hypothetical protein
MTWIARRSFLVSPSCAHLHAYGCDDAFRYSVYHAIPSELILSSHYVRGRRNLASFFFCVHADFCPFRENNRLYALCTQSWQSSPSHSWSPGDTCSPPLSFPSYLFVFIFPSFSLTSTLQLFFGFITLASRHLEIYALM